MRASCAILIAGALLLAACERGPQPEKKAAEAKPRTLAEIDGAVARLEERNRELEASLRKLERNAARWVMWQSAQPVHGGAAFLPPPLPVAAFADKEPCVEATQEAVNSAQRVISKTGPASYQAVGADGVLMQITYTCLPETIDPRRPAAAR
jgi:hypothetical protein